MSESIRIRNLTKTFSGTIRAIDGVSLLIEPGELFFLLGPSGCGKTTLLRTIAGFVQPDAGTIQIGEREITRLPPHQRDTGMVFQSYALWPHLNVRQNVAFGLEMRGMSKAEINRRTHEALARVQMENKAESSPNELSGGQQQRIALARALVVEPKCLLLDEPLSNLDAKLRLEMRQEIRRICKSAGITAVYVTHDQKEALSIADRLAVLCDGSIQQVGTPREVYRRPASRFVAGFIGESNFLPGTVTGRHGSETIVRTAIGTLYGTAANLLPEGTSVTVSVRPEAVRASTPPSDNPNRLKAECTQVVYLGEYEQHLLSIQGTEWKRFTWNPEAKTPVGRHEWVWIDPSDVIVLQE